MLAVPTFGLMTGEFFRLGLRIVLRSEETLVNEIILLLLLRIGSSGGGCCGICCRCMMLPDIELTSALDTLKLQDICDEDTDELP